MTHSFGALIRQLRLARGLTQAVLAERAGVAERTIQDLERRSARPRRDTVRRLIATLDPSSEERAQLEAIPPSPRRVVSNVDTLRQRPRRQLGDSVERPPSGLPVLRSRLIGREREAETVRQLLLDADVALVTVTGPGGVGKTRLALQVATELRAAFSDGVYFVELASIVDPALVTPTIARALGLSTPGGCSVLDPVIDYLRSRAVLLVLDNFEQILEAAPVISQLLAASPNLKVLVTSRESLRLRGEREYGVPPLRLPHPHHLPALETLAEYGAVALFIERARAIRSSFVVTSENAAAVVEICSRLDGLPLAIELAAARVRLLTPQAIVARLERRLPLLTGGTRDGPARQRTLRDAITWSHDLLDESERRLFRRLSVFVGGWSFDAAAAICGPESDLGVELLYGLESLVAKSLISERGDAHGEPRFSMLETVREYGVEQLQVSRELQSIQRRHAKYFVTLAEQAEPMLSGPDQQPWLDHLHAELDNFRAAFSWSIGGGEPEGALRLASALLPFWVVRADWSEGRQWVERALRLPGDVDLAVRMKGLRAAAELADLLSDYSSATAYYEQSLTLARRLQDRRGIANALFGLAQEALRVGDLAARRPLLEESAAVFREIGDDPSIARSLGGLAELEENFAEARSLWERNVTIRRKLGNQEGVAWSLLHVGEAAQGAGDYWGAQAAYEEVLTIGRGLGYKRMIARALTQTAEVVMLEGKPAAARTLFEETLPIWRAVGHKNGLADSLRGLGDALRLAGDNRAAERVARESLALSYDIGARRRVAASLLSLARLSQSRGDDEGAERLFREALSLWTEMRRKEGIADCIRGLAEVDSGRGRFDRSARLFGASEALRRTIGGVIPPCDQAAYERAVARVRAGLDASSFDIAWREGQALYPEQAVAYTLERSAST